MRINADGSYGWGRVFPTSGSNISQALDIRVLSNGDIVTAISFEGTLTLPSGTITAAAGFDIVVVKTNADASSLIWRSSLQGSSTDWIDEVHVSTSGNVSLVGGFSSATTTLTSSDSSTTVLTRASGASSSAYAVSLTSAGVASYATVVGPTNSYSRSSTISSTGEVLVFVNTGDLIKVSTSGVASTVGSFGATVAAFGMAHLASGELAMGGEFSGTVDLDPSSGVASRTPTAIGSASFVARLSSTYSLTQLHVIDGNNSDSISSVAASASGGLLATGTGISASVNLSNTTHDGSFTRAAGTDSMAFVVRYDAAGTSGVPTTTTTTTTTVPPTSTLPLTSAPTTVSYKTSNKKITLSWTAVSGASTYVVRNASGSSVCTGAATSCVVSGLKNGKSYTYSVRSVNGAGVESATATSKTVIPGFTLKKTAFKKNAKPNFATIMTTPSRGIQKWTIRSGKCAVQGGRVVMPAKKGTCRITVSVGKKGSYAAMTTSLVVTAQ